MTKIFRECTDSMSNDELTDWYRRVLTHVLNSAWSEGKILEYRYKLIAIDLLEVKTDEQLQEVSNEIEIGLVEKERSLLLERMAKGCDMIRTETDEKRKEKLWKHYDKLEKELEELNIKWTLQTKYKTWIETLS